MGLTDNFFEAPPMRSAESYFPRPTVRRRPKGFSAKDTEGQFVPLQDFRGSVDKMKGVVDLLSPLLRPPELRLTDNFFEAPPMRSAESYFPKETVMTGGKDAPKKEAQASSTVGALLPQASSTVGALLPYKMGNKNPDAQRIYDNERFRSMVGGDKYEAMSVNERDANVEEMKRGDFKYNALSKARQKFFGRGSQGSGAGSSSGPLASDRRVGRGPQGATADGKALDSDRRVGRGPQGSGGGSGKALDSDRNVGYGSQGSGGGSSRGPLDSDRSLGYGTRGQTYSPHRDLTRARKLKRRGAPEAAKALEMKYALGPDAPAVQSVRQRKTLQEDNEAAQRQHQLNLEIMKASMATNLNQNRFDRINLA